MNEEEIGDSRHLPARGNALLVAALLRLKAEDLSIPAVKKLVPPLNDLGPGIVRYWSTAEVLEIGKDADKMRKITMAIYLYWKSRSAAKRTKGSSG